MALGPVSRGSSLTCTHAHTVFSCERDSPVVHVYDGHGGSSEMAVLDSLHSSPLTFMEVGMSSSPCSDVM